MDWRALFGKLVVLAVAVAAAATDPRWKYEALRWESIVLPLRLSEIGLSRVQQS